MKKIILIITCLLLTINTNAQANDSEALLYNVGISGIFATIGSIINKKPNEKLNKVLLKSFAQGSLGGIVSFGSKCLLRETERKQNLNYVWSAKIMNAAGTSIIENAAMNRNFWEKWNINIGFNRLEFETKNKFSVRYKIMPIALVYNLMVASQTKFELEKSLKTGEFVFSSDSPRFKATNSIAATYPGSIVIKNDEINNFNVINHEIIHIYQSNTFSILNTYFQKPLDKISEKNKTFKFINKYFYLDLHYLPLRMIYNSQTKSSNYYSNFFEHEAGYFANTLR